MSYTEATLHCPSEAVELVEYILNEHGALAISLYGPDNKPVLEPNPGQTPLWETLKIVGLFETVDKEALLALFPQITFSILEDTNWALTWQKDYKTLQFGRLFVGPTPPADYHAPYVFLEPGMAFGTGTHPTTAMCLQRLAEMDLGGKRVCDFGCGSGILAIAALKLGATAAYGIDHDNQAHIATAENAQKNGVHVELLPDATVSAPYDVVVANILSGPLVELSSLLSSILKPGGNLLLSGIINTQAADVIAAYPFHLSIKNEKEEWILLEGIKHA